MAPSRTRPVAAAAAAASTEDMKTESGPAIGVVRTSGGLKERGHTLTVAGGSNGKGRNSRQVHSSTTTTTTTTTATITTTTTTGGIATSSLATGMNLEGATDATTATAQSGNGGVSSHGGGGGGGPETGGGTGIAWSSFELSTLHDYRHAYRLNTAAAFSSPLNQMILSNPGIGRYSPTMARARERRRVGKDDLALAVRKHFNGLGVQEGEVVVDFLYKVRWQNKEFRMRFGPRVSKP